MFQPEGLEFRKSTFCYLGIWHVYKMATTCVWRLAGQHFLAPLFHVFFPNNKFPTSPRLVLSSRILSLIRLAYPFFRVQLERALAKEALSPKQKGHLTNLQLLCEWFIPKVRYFSSSLIFLTSYISYCRSSYILYGYGWDGYIYFFDSI